MIQNVFLMLSKSKSNMADLKKGTILTKEMFTLKKPGNGIKEKEISKILGKKLIRDVKTNRLIKLDDIAKD